MKENEILRAIGDIGEDLIAESTDDIAFRNSCRGAGHRRIPRALAACLLLVVLAVPLLTMPMWRVQDDRTQNGNYASSTFPTLSDQSTTFSDLQDDMLSAATIMLSLLPAEGGIAEGVTVQITVADLLCEAPAGLYVSVLADGLSAFPGMIALQALAVDEQGRRTFDVALVPDTLPEEGENQGTLTLSLISLPDEESEAQTLLEKSYTYRLTSQALCIEEVEG